MKNTWDAGSPTVKSQSISTGNTRITDIGGVSPQKHVGVGKNEQTTFINPDDAAEAFLNASAKVEVHGAPKPAPAPETKPAPKEEKRPPDRDKYEGMNEAQRKAYDEAIKAGKNPAQARRIAHNTK